MIHRLATRGSALALWQARRTQELLREAGHDAELVIIESSGDRDRQTDLARFGSIGIFTVEVDRAVTDGRADIGVHSLKDMTTTLHEGVQLAGCLERGMIEDALVARDGLRLHTLPRGATVGSGSQRRGAMLRAARPDLNVVQIRGNVPTRLGKVTGGELDATVLARAGLVRLGLDGHITEVLDAKRFLPAVGQGIVGLTCRVDDDERADALARHVRDADAWAAAMAERSFLRRMKGGCNAPAGGHATVRDGELVLSGRVLSLDGAESVEGRVEGPIDDAEALGIRLADDIDRRGGGRLIELARAASQGS
ncbi:Porphobilinogen deaminase [Planctomycetes bacterium Poly30]|uniref:Porphobilinogen deaminase n=1 Tax=Saltatorellus ferox TaxID=2528018 RepID=A0A518F0U5_9BACT|nr:Porphobilinogen deaminase [Planctomycetes bacterium Poly30]